MGVQCGPTRALSREVAVGRASPQAALAAPGPLLQRRRRERGTSPDLEPERAGCGAERDGARRSGFVALGLVALRVRPFIPDRNMNHRGLVLSLSRRNAWGYLKRMSRRCAASPLSPALAAGARVRLGWALAASLGLAGASACAAAAQPAADADDARSVQVRDPSPSACLSQSPVDLSLAPKDAAPSFYVNELVLGYARGEAIFLSRPLCDMYGQPLCRFVAAHEQAHHYTKTVGHRSRCAETLADCWAAAHSDEEAVAAALEFFRSRRGAGGYHGDPDERAITIAQCARRWAKRAAHDVDATTRTD